MLAQFGAPFCAFAMENPPPPPAAETDLSADEIMRRALARDETLRRGRQRFECDLRIKTERVDAGGAVLSSEAKGFTVRPGTDLARTALVALDSGRTAREKDAAEARKFLAAMDLQKLAPRFRMTRAGEETVQGRPCFVIAYAPRPGARYDNSEEKIMNGLAGRFWVTRDDFSILQSEGSLTAPVTVALVASVWRFDFSYRSLPLPAGGEPAPAAFEMFVAVKAPLYDLRQRQTSTMSNYR